MERAAQVTSNRFSISNVPSAKEVSSKQVYGIRHKIANVTRTERLLQPTTRQEYDLSKKRQERRIKAKEFFQHNKIPDLIGWIPTLSSDKQIARTEYKILVQDIISYCYSHKCLTKEDVCSIFLALYKAPGASKSVFQMIFQFNSCQDKHSESLYIDVILLFLNKIENSQTISNDINARNKEGDTVLQICTKQFCIDLHLYWDSLFRRFDTKNNVAIIKAMLKLIGRLLQLGANPSMKDKNGESIIELVEKKCGGRVAVLFFEILDYVEGVPWCNNISKYRGLDDLQKALEQWQFLWECRDAHEYYLYNQVYCFFQHAIRYLNDKKAWEFPRLTSFNDPINCELPLFIRLNYKINWERLFFNQYKAIVSGFEGYGGYAIAKLYTALLDKAQRSRAEMP